MRFRYQLSNDVPRQELLDTIDRMFGDASEHVAQIRFRIQPVQFGRANKGINSGGTLASGVGAGEQIVFPSQDNG